jgi:hypothetical protein
MCSRKKVASALQLQRELRGGEEGKDAEPKKIKGSHRTAWFMCGRNRWAMTQSPMADAIQRGGNGGVAEVDVKARAMTRNRYLVFAAGFGLIASGPNFSSSFAICDFVGCAPGRGIVSFGLTRSNSEIALSVVRGMWTLLPGRAM